MSPGGNILEGERGTQAFLSHARTVALPQGEVGWREIRQRA